MARFDVYVPEPGLVLLDVQTDWLFESRTRVVVPLVPLGLLKAIGEATPVIDVLDTRWRLATHLLFSSPSAGLGFPVANAAGYRDQVLRALDLLFTGF